ncbi:MAG: T9SS type A sorting domain-containing protein [Sphingobacteriaceae bacterium]|nr:T9SS type A sorting domain-containing protein [Sphingobacteriaceae bacterium]
MKKIFTLLAFVVAASFGLKAQTGYYMIAHTYAPGNPGGLNQDNEFPVGGGIVAGWNSILAGSNAAATYSPVQTIPFTFNFNGAPVTQYKAGSSGIVTFNTASTNIPAYGVNTFPSANIPDNSVVVFGMEGTGANDHIVTKTFGTAPNRQHWIQFNSYSIPGNTACWTYWAVVLEESTNNIYLVDQRYANCTSNFTIGLLANQTTTFGPSAPVPPLAGTDAGASTNHYYQFIPGTQPALGAKLASSSIAPFIYLNAPNTVAGRILNLGSSAITSGSLHYRVNNGAAVTQALTGLNIAGGTMYNFTHGTPLTVTTAGIYSISMWMSNINGAGVNTDTLTVSISALSSVISNLVVFEHFTNASCGPCATQNPGLEAVMNNNKLKATSLKYHVSWPGVDPMYSFNPTDPTARVNYYGVSGVPAVRLGANASMSPSQVTQTVIDNYHNNMPNAFTYTVNTRIENNTLFVDGSVIRNIGINSNDLVLHIAVVEDPINYATPPGTNGEKDFPMVVRKLLPNQNGTNLGNGETATPFNYNYPLPSSFLQDRLFVVVFVQANASKIAYKGAKIKAGASLASSVKNDALISGSFEVYPNPVSSQAVLNFNLVRDSEVAVEIMNISGQLVHRLNLGDLFAGTHSHTVDLSHLAAGMYYVKTSMNDQVEIKRIVKQ